MRPSSHFRVAFLVLSSVLLAEVTPLSDSCMEYCRERGRAESKGKAFDIDCGRREDPSQCGLNCVDNCVLSDCGSDGSKVRCPGDTAGIIKTRLSDMEIAGIVIGGILCVGLLSYAIYLLIYRCWWVKRVTQRRPPVMMGGGVAPTPQGSYYPSQMESLGGNERQPTGGENASLSPQPETQA